MHQPFVSIRLRALVLGALAVVVAVMQTPASADFLLNGDIRYAMDGPVEFINPVETNLLISRNDGDTEFATGANVGGDLIVGDEGTGGLLGSDALPLITFDLSTGEATNLKPLRSDNAVLGNQLGSEGTAALSGFMFLPAIDPADGDPVAGHTEPFGGNWRIREDFVIGNNGVGTLDILNRARVEVGGLTTIGGTTSGDPLFDTSQANFGAGNLNINGVNSRLVTTNLNGGAGSAALLVGVDTQGIVDVSGGAVLETRNSAGFPDGDGTTVYTGPPGAAARTVVVGLDDGGDGLVRLRDSGSLWDIDGDLFIANDGNTGVGVGTSFAQGSVEIIDDALLQVGGSITVNSRGNLVMRGGTARLFSAIASTTRGTITNNGNIIGDGLIDADIQINATGVVSNRSVEIDNAGTVTTVRELLTVTGMVTNVGLIESNGGEMVFQEAVNNAGGTVLARDATMQFDGGLMGGDLVLLGASTIIGNATNPTSITTNSFTGAFAGAPGTEVRIIGNVLFDPQPQVLFAASSDGPIAAGTGLGPEIFVSIDEVSPLFIEGDLDLNGIPTLDVDYFGVDPIEVGDILTAISASGDITGTFANDDFVSDGFVWDIDIVGNDVFVEAVSMFTGIPGDFDGDGDVDGTDFLTLQRNGAAPGDLSAWQSNYGNSSGGSVAASTAVPEPATLVLALLFLACCPCRRRP